MNLKKLSYCFLSIIFVIITVVSFASCSLNKEKSVYELVTTRYSYRKLEEIFNFARETECSYDELNEKYPIECTRYCEYNNRVTYVGVDNEVLPIYFKKDGTFSYIEPAYKPVLSKSELYIAYKFCKDAYELSEVDTAGRYWFFYTGSMPDPPVSSHVTTDGYYVDIYYDAHPQFNITDIKFELM